jgi:hypothetical protein
VALQRASYATTNRIYVRAAITSDVIAALHWPVLSIVAGLHASIEGVTNMTGFWHRWMIIWCWVTIVFGAVLALSAIAALRAPTLLFLDLVFWPLDGQQANLSREAVFGVSLCGAIMLGWGALMLGLARDEKLSREPRIWQIMTTGMVLWFVVDSLASWLAGAGVNVLSNAVFVVAYLVPVVKSGVLSGTRLSPRTV